ncbi:MAG: MopE-related protein, partial [Myxococcota bacterium]
SECDDGNPCNGLESCDGNRCELLSGPMDGLACSRGGDDGVCRSGICVAEGCGNGIVDDGEDCDDENTVEGDGCEADCTFSCVADVDCGDGDECTVGESCDTDAHRCIPGAPLACDDADPCTEDLCEALSGCVHPLIDDDGDGHAPSTLGECGTDCDDDNASVFAGAEELCDDIDNNCDGTADETTVTWYVDCDGDGFAADTAGAVTDCVPPPVVDCEWTSTRPASATTTDCYDGNADVFPGQERYFSTAHTRLGGSRSFDYNCDGDEERRYDCVQPGQMCSRFLGCRTGILGFSPATAHCFQSSAATGRTGPTPECGASGRVTTCISGLDSCTERSSVGSQACR